MKTSLLVKLVCGLALLGAILPASAFAQATRTWVSGVGDDANPCSRTAPCKTFSGAISKTAAGGEINCLDPGGFGGLTITKSITIKCHYTEGGALVSGTNDFVVNAAATDKVVIRGLDFNGLGTGLNGFRILQAKTVELIDVEIYGFTRNGVDMEASNNGARLLVANSHIHDNNGAGVMVAPPSGGNSTVTLHNNLIASNGCGIVATNHLPDPAFVFTQLCGTLTNGVGGAAKINAFKNVIADSNGTNGVGVFSNGQSSNIRIGENEVTGNNLGMQSVDPGPFGGVFSYNDNFFVGNVTDGTAQGTITKK